jgi:hypothetical protein
MYTDEFDDAGLDDDFLNEIDPTGEVSDKYYKSLASASPKDKDKLLKLLRYNDGRAYAQECDPEFLTEEQISDELFVKGYNFERNLLGKSTISRSI